MGAEASLHILMTTDTVGGVWQHSLELAAALCRRRCRVTLAAMGEAASPAQRAQADAIDGLDLHTRPLKLEWMHDPWDDIARAGDWLRQLGHGARFDAIHLNQFAFGTLPFDAPKLLVAHSTVTSWWRAVHGRIAPASWDRYRAVVRAGLLGADRIAAPTRAMLESLWFDFDIDAADSGRVLPNGRSAWSFGPLAKEPLIVGAGRFWDEAKNLGALDRAAATVAWPVAVAGPTRGPDGSAYTAANLRLLGELSQDALAGWLGRAAICAHPARYEPFGQSVLEAALAGCALVLGDIASLRETWGPAALYVEPDDSPALSRTLQALIDDEPLRCRMSALARQRARVFTPEAMVAAYLKTYRAMAVVDTVCSRSPSGLPTGARSCGY